MSSKPEPTTRPKDIERLRNEITRLAQSASVEVNVQDESDLNSSQQWLTAGTKLYVSHLPGQTWQATSAMCAAVRRAGFEPVPHLPVRLLASAGTLDQVLQDLTHAARPRGILVISGDYPAAQGPFSDAAQVLATGALERHGFTAVSVAGHPEGHRKVADDEIRRAEIEKTAIAVARGLEASVLTQFLFEPEPFIRWTRDLQSRGVSARLVCGLAGPAKITTLFRYATRCGVGASIRAVGARPSSLKNMLGDHGPDRMLRRLAQARMAGELEFAGVHVFCFGGFLRTVEWLAQVAAGRISLNESGGFDT